MPQHRPLPLTALPWLAVLATGLASAAPADDADADPTPPPAQSSAPAIEQPSAQAEGYVDPIEQWLGEVKAQRRAWEERRRATREAINARRRLSDPWGAAHLESHEKESQRRRDAMMEQIERDRETFREEGPWQLPSPMDERPPPPPAAAVPPGAGDSQSPAAAPSYPPSGWDNRWYYRGY